MAMNGTLLGDAMYAASGVASDPNLSAAEKSQIQTAYQNIYGVSIVTHITTLAQLAGLVVTVASVTGVTPGPGASGPGTGTAIGAPGSIT